MICGRGEVMSVTHCVGGCGDVWEGEVMSGMSEGEVISHMWEG